MSIVTNFNRTDKLSTSSSMHKNDAFKRKSLCWHDKLYIVFIKQDKIKKINKFYYGIDENVTLVNVFIGGTFPFTQAIIVHS